MDRFFAAVGTFFVVLFAQIFALAAAEGFGGLRIDPFGSRNALFFVALGLSVAAAILRATRVRPGPGSRTESNRTTRGARGSATPSVAPAGTTGGAGGRTAPGSETSAPAGPRAGERLNAPSAAAGPRADELLAAAARQAIVFRQHFPPRDDAAHRSFFGGKPLVPRGFAWPRSRDTDRPLHFLLQVDCAAVPPSARLGALPDRGVLCFFLDLSWQTFSGRVLHADTAGDAWEALEPPADLGPAFGKEAHYVWGWVQAGDHAPALLPRWTFDPVAIELPEPVREEDDEDQGPVLWPEAKTAQLLLDAQGDASRYEYLTVRDVVDGQAVRRPFPTFPHDWRALQICSNGLVQQAERERRYGQTSAFREMDPDARNAMLAGVIADAQAWFDRAAAQPPFDEVHDDERDAFWELVARHPSLSRSMLVEALTKSIEASFAHSTAAAARVPAALAARIRGRHALAVRTDDRIHANIPDRMLAPPVDVQGNHWERAQTHLLLLELSSNEGLGHHFGEGVFQFWILPDDLVAGRFDRVEVTSDAY